MKFVELAKSLKEGVAPVYLVEGEESYFRDHAVESIRAACGLINPALNDARYEGELFHEGIKYEFEIDPRTGRIVDWNADLRG